MRGKHNKLGEGERKVRLGQDSLPNIAISVAETSGNYICCFTRTPGVGLARKYYDRLEREKHSSLFVVCGEGKKSFRESASVDQRIGRDIN